MRQLRDPIRETWEKRLQALAGDYEAAYGQSTDDPNAVARSQAKRNAAAIEREMEELQCKLDARERNRPHAERNPDRLVRGFEQDMHEIDFDKVDEALRQIFAQHSSAGRAGLLLFQRSSAMNGRLCAARVRERLRPKTSPGKFRPERVALQPVDINGRFRLLRRIAAVFGDHWSELPDGDELVAEVTKTLVGSLDAGGILLLEIDGCELLEHDPGAFEWLVTVFWRSVLRELEARKDARVITLIMLLFVDVTVPDGVLAPEICCSEGMFRRDRLLDVPLAPWTYDDVLQWIAAYAAPDGYPHEQLEWLAKRVMKASNREPCRIEQELLTRCAGLEPV
jgi:hypothetical protein